MKWMHLSDIHINKNFNNVSSDIIRWRLPKYLKDCKIKVDYLFITGDYRDCTYLKDIKQEEDIEEVNLFDDIVKAVDKIRTEYDKVKVHLFYNGFIGIAVLLGNQMPTTFEVQLYDYDMSNTEYTSSFLLKSDIFI